MSVDSSELRSRLLAHVRRPGYQPLDKVGLSKALGLRADDRKRIREALDSLEDEGALVRLRADRYGLPEEAGLVAGKLEIHRGGSAHLLVAGELKSDIFIATEKIGTGMHGDRVLVELTRPTRRAREGESRQEGRVVKVLERATSTVVGTLQRSGRKQLLVAPDDARFPHQVLVRPTEGRLSRPPHVGDKVVVQLDPWENAAEPPRGHITEVLGPASAPGVDMLAIVRKYDLRAEFPAPVLREAEVIPERLTTEDLEGREDLREQPAITIDPDDARDFDDAIFVERLKGWLGRKGGWRLWVHIADVSHYVAQNTALDAEARRRGNSTYLVDRVIPMLPERLSNGICSLKPHVERLTFSAIIDFTAEGQIKSSRFAKTVIKSAARLSYRQAYAILQGEKTMPPLPPTLSSEESRGKATLAAGPHVPVEPQVAERVQTAWELASVLRRNRYANGSLDLDFPEVKIWLDENGHAARMEKMENDISHQLIEECMLAANEVVALEIKNKLVPTVYRIHEDPDADRLLEFRDFAGEHGFRSGDLTNRNEVQKLLKSIQGSPEEYAIKLQFLKSLKRAVYDTRPLGHYGLAKVNYAHFTSPIRRYADLLVHRSLEHIVRRGVQGAPTRTNRGLRGGRKGSGTPVAADMEELAVHISQTERTSTDAERDSVSLKKLEFFQRQLVSQKPQEFQAVVVDVRFFGLMVELPEILTSGMVHVNAMRDDHYLFDATKRAFIGRRTRRRVQVGDRLTVVVDRVDVMKRQMDFAPVRWAAEDSAKDESRNSRRGGTRGEPIRQRSGSGVEPNRRRGGESRAEQERPRSGKNRFGSQGERPERDGRGKKGKGKRQFDGPERLPKLDVSARPKKGTARGAHRIESERLPAPDRGSSQGRKYSVRNDVNREGRLHPGSAKQSRGDRGQRDPARSNIGMSVGTAELLSEPGVQRARDFVKSKPGRSARKPDREKAGRSARRSKAGRR